MKIKMATQKKKSAFAEIRSILSARRYPSFHMKGSYWVWQLGEGLVLYERFVGETGESSKVFLDAAQYQLRNILAKVVGIVSPQRTTPNSKFSGFSRRTDSNGNFVHEGWKFSFDTAEAVRNFLHICEEYSVGGVEAALTASASFDQIAPPITSKSVQLESRVGQSKYRQQLLSYWRGCAVTGCTKRLLLRSSHIKAWSLSTSYERLDSFNGLLLTPNLDALFDAGLISFEDNRSVLISSELSVDDLHMLGVTNDMKLRKINGAHLPYLQHHRSSCFKP